LTLFQSTLGTVPAGYEAVSLIEALNGPVQYSRPPHPPLLSKRDRAVESDNSAAVQAAEALSR